MQLSKLRHLELTACTAFEEGDLALLAPLAHLRYLDLGPFTSFTDKALQVRHPLPHAGEAYLMEDSWQGQDA